MGVETLRVSMVPKDTLKILLGSFILYTGDDFFFVLILWSIIQVQSFNMGTCRCKSTTRLLLPLVLENGELALWDSQPPQQVQQQSSSRHI